MTPSKLLVIFYGGPGSGKTTQATLLAKRIGALHIAMGVELRAKSKKNAEIKDKMLRGQLVPLHYSLEIIEDKLRKNKDKSVILDGFPRNLVQARSINKLISKYNFAVKFVLLDVSEKVVIKRLLHRGKTQNRADDQDIKIIQSRINLFNKNSASLLAYYKKRNELVIVQSDGPVAATASKINKAIK